MIAAAAAAISAGVSAATLDAQVYDVTLTAKTTACKEIKYTKTIATLEGEHWEDVKGDTISVRKQATTKIAGVIWGCECETFADPAWRLYNNGKTVGGYVFWNVTGKEMFRIAKTSFAWAVFNRIDKGEKVEGAWALSKDPTLGFLGAGFGSVKGLDCRATLTSMSGSFAGFILAGDNAGGCAFCGATDCDAWQVCPCIANGANVYPLGYTVAYGTWKIKYNKSASKKLRKTGRITQSYNFKNAGDTEARLTKVEDAAANGTLVVGIGAEASEDEDLWNDGVGEHDEWGELISKYDADMAAYGVYNSDSEEWEYPAGYDLDDDEDAADADTNAIIDAILALADAS